MARNLMMLRTAHGTAIEVPYYTVYHLTDYSTKAPFSRPCMLGETAWFDETSARNFARGQSEIVPQPQRFTVYCPDMTYVASYQCGKELSAFEVVA